MAMSKPRASLEISRPGACRISHKRRVRIKSRTAGRAPTSTLTLALNPLLNLNLHLTLAPLAPDSVMRHSLAERQQVADDISALTLAQTESRHQAARLDGLRVRHPAAEILGRVRDDAGGERLPAHQVCQVWCVAALCGRAA